MSAVVIIPARMASSRFPGKPLVSLKGKPLIQHVYERASEASLAREVMVATDSDEIYEVVLGFGGRAVMTSGKHASGTDRIAEAAGKTDYDIIINVQGDEPLIRADMIDTAIGLLADSRADLGTLARKIEAPLAADDPNTVKVVFDMEGFALYFSRANIPHSRNGVQWGPYEHVGIYSYRREALLRLAGLEPTGLERTEKLEQLRALEHGMRIKVALTEHKTIGVDTPEDLVRAERWLS